MVVIIHTEYKKFVRQKQCRKKKKKKKKIAAFYQELKQLCSVMYERIFVNRDAWKLPMGMHAIY